MLDLIFELLILIVFTFSIVFGLILAVLLLAYILDRFENEKE